MVDYEVPDDAASRWWKRVEVRGKYDCWRWLGGTTKKGYGAFYLNKGLYVGASRIGFRIINGRWPHPQIDHTCNHTWCQNPAHWDEVTNVENTRRRDERLGNPAARTNVCANGHDITRGNSNTYIDKYDHRVCRACARDKQRRYAERRRQNAN